MGEVQRQKYICKICNKSCVSGKSLGGHMRVHLALISASKKAQKEKAEIKLKSEGGGVGDGGCQLRESSKNQSNSALEGEENENHCDADQNNYELRENPKKTWRISDSKNGGVLKNGASCKECGKEFPSLRALSGHMRSHSVKNGKVHHCKKCGKGFDSMRAMFGHMKSHSTRSKVSGGTAESLPDMDGLCPIRRKRSRIRYKIAPNSCPYSLDASTSAVSENGEVEEVANSLMMLSRGVRDWVTLESVTESSDDDSVYYGAESSGKRKNSGEGDTDFVRGSDKKMKMSLLSGELDNCNSGSATAFSEKNVSEFDDLGSKLAAEDHEIVVDLVVSNVGQPSAHKVVEPGQLNVCSVGLDIVDDSRSFGSAKYSEPCKHLSGATRSNEASSESFKSDSWNKGGPSACEYGFEKNYPENEAKEVEILKDFAEKQAYKRRTCDKTSNSHCPLGGHNIMQNVHGNSPSMCMNTSLLSVAKADSKLECSNNQFEQESMGRGTVSMEASTSKEHESPICSKVFSSGQVLGTHETVHYTGSAESKSVESVTMKQEVVRANNLLDLNYPIAVEEGTKSGVGHNLWWIDRGPEHEALVLTN